MAHRDSDSFMQATILSVCCFHFAVRQYMRILFLALAIAVLTSCHGTQKEYGVPQHFVVDVMLPTTPVKDQGRTEACWIYAMLATLESDRLAMGDSVNLSPMWCARKSIEEQSRRTFLCGDTITLRGTLPEAMRLIERYGVVTYDSYRPDIVSGNDLAVAARSAYHTSAVMSAQRSTLERQQAAVTEILDSRLSAAPHLVFLYGMEYTPQLFAESIALPEEWHPVTSFRHHEYFSSFAPELPDNRQHHEAYNVPLDSLMAVIDTSLENRHPVAWEGCMTSLASRMENGSKDITAVTEMRQRLFERHILTDDHCMAIIGYGHTPDGSRYYILKNSWGEEAGFCYISRLDMMLRTVMVMAKRDSRT